MLLRKVTLFVKCCICVGCYYQYRHYDEGEQIITNEPCLNCTCHNQMLMCFLRYLFILKSQSQHSQGHYVDDKLTHVKLEC